MENLTNSYKPNTKNTHEGEKKDSINIIAAVIGFFAEGALEIQDIDDNEVNKLMLEVKRVAGPSALIIKQVNECIILLAGSSDEDNYNIITSINHWINENRQNSINMKMYIGIDRREFTDIECIRKCMLIARYRMYKGYLNNAQSRPYNSNFSKSLINVLKDIMNSLLEINNTNRLSEEILEISTIIDKLLVNYVSENIKLENANKAFN